MPSFILPVDKPVGPTSHDVVAIARRGLHEKRIGHTGTLDPFASGLLLLCVGHATRLAEYFAELPKTYRATAHFDGVSDTDDLTGEIAHSDVWRKIDPAAVERALGALRGDIMQVPSKYSAKKIDGQRAYDLARRGEAVDLAPVPVTVYDIRMIRCELPVVEFEVVCSSGTYVRAIARDAGNALGTGGYLAALRRTAIGDFSVENAVALAETHDAAAVQRAAVPMHEALSHMAQLEVDEAQETALRFGQAISQATTPGALVLLRAGELIGIAESDGERVRPRKVFARG
jgi:tRNA pseudouridine55 synthase